ncbi:MAG TPA: methyltransferase [Gammaproteobacteria bacterium]|nr:methyltransferase [Gammaproteobacteria bacterium]
MIPVVPKPIEDYCLAHTSPTDPLLEELAGYTRAHCKMPQMLTGPVEGTFLRMLMQTSGARRVLEIGTFTGYSALSMAAGLPDDGELVTCDIDPDTNAIARSFWARSPHGGKISPRLGPALETLATLPVEPAYDLVFIDADKENYQNYYEAVLPRLRAGGLIAADNTLWSGKVLDPREKSDHAIVAFNDHIRKDPRVEHVLLSVRDGVLLIRKREADKI